MAFVMGSLYAAGGEAYTKRAKEEQEVSVQEDTALWSYCCTGFMRWPLFHS